MRIYGRCYERGVHLDQSSFEWNELPYLAAWLMQAWAHETERQQPAPSQPHERQWLNSGMAHLIGGPLPPGSPNEGKHPVLLGWERQLALARQDFQQKGSEENARRCEQIVALIKDGWPEWQE